MTKHEAHAWFRQTTHDQARSEPDASPSARLRRIATAVERLGISGRTTPEDILVSKLTIALQLRRLAAEIEAGR